MSSIRVLRICGQCVQPRDTWTDQFLFCRTAFPWTQKSMNYQKQKVPLFHKNYKSLIPCKKWAHMMMQISGHFYFIENREQKYKYRPEISVLHRSRTVWSPPGYPDFDKQLFIVQFFLSSSPLQLERAVRPFPTKDLSQKASSISFISHLVINCDNIFSGLIQYFLSPCSWSKQIWVTLLTNNVFVYNISQYT